jgi:hypothetical protein
MQNVKNYIIGTIITLGAAVLYEKYVRHDKKLQALNNQALIKQYLLNDSLEDIKKPILWIHVTHEKNSRWWQSFYSRNTEYLNQPYIFLTIRSIIQHCADNFHICLIDDESFSSLIPGWKHNVSQMADPIRSHVRSLALTKVLYTYGGMLVPNSFICTHNLLPLYSAGLASTDMFVCENQSTSNVVDKTYYFPNMSFIGCNKESDNMHELSNSVSRVISSDYTNQMDFTGELNRLCYDMVINGKISVVCGSKIGVKKQNGEPLAIEELMGDSYIDMPSGMLGLYIPSDRILSRTKYQWFARLSVAQALQSKTMIGKYLVVSHAGI